MELITVKESNIEEIYTKLKRFMKREASMIIFQREYIDGKIFELGEYELSNGTIGELYDMIYLPISESRNIPKILMKFKTTPVKILPNDVLEIHDNTIVLHKNPYETGVLVIINFK